MPKFHFIPASSLVLAGAALSLPDVAYAQEVVQPLPSQASRELTDALSRLSRNSRNIDALIAAGTASLELDDVEAAVGFFGRAKDLAPNDPRIKAGQAAALVRSRRPVDGLMLFQEAEAQGVEIVRLAADFGLAYDLVGNNREAQARYRRALAQEESPEVTRRLALSQAIDGDEAGFEATLRPLLEKRDFGAYRTRAFGLAILGRSDDAVAIADAVMPRSMAAKLEPYLRFMPRLTKAQQAAAGNLGVYPTAGQIGRDDPRIAALGGSSAPGRRARVADAALAPAGTPLGRTPPQTTEADQPDATAPAEEEVVAVASREEAERTVRVARREAASDPLSRTQRRPRIVRRSPDSGAPQPRPETQPTPSQNPTPTQGAASEVATVAAAEPARGEPRPSAVERAPEAELPAQLAVRTSAANTEPVVVARADEAPQNPGFDLARLPNSTATEVVPPSTAASSGQPPAGGNPISGVQAGESPASDTASVADAFADLAPMPATIGTTPVAGAVDITAIDVRRDVADEPAAEPATPAHPSRYWVQIATGRDRAALKFDWRRLSREADGLLDGKGPFVTAWGQTNRLLAGPYKSRDEARNALKSLAEKGFDAFTFTSPEGQEVDKLD